MKLNFDAFVLVGVLKSAFQLKKKISSSPIFDGKDMWKGLRICFRLIFSTQLQVT